MKKIKLSNGKYALVDDKDYDYLNQWKWGSNGQYACRTVKIANKTKCIYMHRVIIETPLGMHTDHLNRNKLDNRKKNLRVCTHAQNMLNRSPTSRNKSGYSGIYWYKTKNRWQVTIGKKYLGLFKTLEEAINKRKQYEIT